MSRGEPEDCATKLKGDLDSISLGELLQTLASQQATGVLTVSGPLGQKIVAIASGEIAVLSDKTAERSRLGDLLVSRGRLTESQLAEALKLQRQSEQRTRLGDLLIKTGLIKAEDITGALKFQVEEELCDLFTWRNAAFEFDGDRSVDDACADEFGGDSHLQRLSIDPQAVIAEAGRRMAEWKEIENRLPTPYLCFKVTPKGEEFAPKANTSTQQIFALLREGRTIETTVKRSCAGRFNVCRCIIKLLDDGWMFPYPATELPRLANEHRAHNRFSDALFIYRRLVEVADGEHERREIQGMMNDTLESIRKAQEAGETPEGAETVSYKEAAARYKRRQAIKRAASLLFAGAALIAASVALTQAYTPPPRLADDYQEAMKAVQEAVARNKYEEAAKIWQTFYIKIPNKQSVTAQLVMQHLSNLPSQSNAFVEMSLKPIEMQENAGRLDDAEAGFKRLLEQYGQSAYAKRISAGLERIAARRKEVAEERRATELRDRMEKAQALLQKKQYTAARAALRQIADDTPPDSGDRADAERGLKQLADTEARIQAAVEAATAEVRDKKGEKAIESFDKAATEWPDLPATQSARKQSQELRVRLDQARQELRNAESVAAQGAILNAMDSLRRLQRDYPEFELQNTAKERLAALSATADALATRVSQAQEAYKRDKARGRRLFAALVKEQPVYLAARKIEVPAFITSHPAGATVAIDDQPAGVAPVDIAVLVGKPFTLRVEKPGYAPWKENILRLTPEDFLEIHVALSREALRVLEFKPSIVAPPVVLNQQLYVLHGTSLSVQDPLGKQQAWVLPGLLDDAAQTRPNSDGTGTPQFVNDRAWWYPRTPPEQSGPGTLILPLPSREIVEIDEAGRTFKKLVSLPVEPVGRVHLEKVSLLAGKALIAIGCADGKIRTYELAKPAAPLWEKPADPATPAPKGTLATGLASRSNGTFLALSVSGRLTCFNVVNGQESWSMTVPGPLVPADCLPASAQENLAALVHADDGKVTLIDLNQQDTVWELAKSQALDEATHAAVGRDGVYVVTREGVLRKYPRDKCPGKPPPLWRKSLDNGTNVPLALGKNLYVVSTFGTLYALAPGDGHELWKQKIEGTPTRLVEHGNVLYVTTKEGRLVILSTE